MDPNDLVNETWAKILGIKASEGRQEIQVLRNIVFVSIVLAVILYVAFY